MSELPEWLKAALPDDARHAGLALARLGDGASFGRGGFSLTSPAFEPGDELDPCFTAYEEDAVAPPLAWSAPPAGTQELALIVENASVGQKEPLCHWLVWGLPGKAGTLLEGEAPPRTGKNALANSDWLLPDPPLGERHSFVFQIFALDLPLTLMPGASREELLAAMQGHVLASAALVARFTGEEREEDFEEEDDI